MVFKCNFSLFINEFAISVYLVKHCSTLIRLINTKPIQEHSEKLLDC